MANAFVDQAITLAVWWALWTLADFYLILFTPYSEVIVLASAGALVLVRSGWTSASAACSSLISEATQTTPPVRAARAYEKQEEGTA